MSWAIWITGLPGSGKTTVARGVARALRERGVAVRVLELADVRKTLLGGRQGTEHERDIVHRALAYTAKELTEADVPVIVDATALRREWREWAREQIPSFRRGAAALSSGGLRDSRAEGGQPCTFVMS